MLKAVIDFERRLDHKKLINESEKVLRVAEEDKLEVIDKVTSHTLLTM